MFDSFMDNILKSSVVETSSTTGQSQKTDYVIDQSSKSIQGGPDPDNDDDD